MTPTARLRNAKAGPGAAGGKMPSKRSPVSGSSALSSGLPRCTSTPTCAATNRMMRSPSASESSAPSGARPDDSRSTHSVRSGLSMTSTTSGSSRAAAMTGPIAVRSMAIRRSSETARVAWPAALIGLAPVVRPPRYPSAVPPGRAPPLRRAPDCGHARGGDRAARRTARSAPCPALWLPLDAPPARVC